MATTSGGRAILIFSQWPLDTSEEVGINHTKIAKTAAFDHAGRLRIEQGLIRKEDMKKLPQERNHQELPRAKAIAPSQCIRKSSRAC
jgi:hypothetical protein